MITRSEAYQAPFLFSGLAEMLDLSHPLCKLADKIRWQIFDEAFEPLFCKDNGRSAKPIRMMVGLLILKHVRNLSDESIVEQWRENPYYQYFCGMAQFSQRPPCEASELLHFRHRIGERGVELIFKESIRVNDDDELHHSGCGSRPEKETMAFIDSTVQEKNITFPTDTKLLVKIVDWCLKVAKLFRNEYDGHTIDPAMEQVRRLYPHPIKILAGDRGYRGQRQSGDTRIEIPDSPQASDSAYQRKKKYRHFCKRAGIEPVIGHLKSDNRLGRNFYRGLFGDSINVMLAAAAFNFKRSMHALFMAIFRLLQRLCEARMAVLAQNPAIYCPDTMYASGFR